MSLKPYGITVERLCHEQPIISPTENWWESGVTFNSAAIYLERSPENDPIIRKLIEREDLSAPELKEGVVALHYRARPKHDEGFRFNRSFVGLAVFTPKLTLLKRFSEPVIFPGETPSDPDYLGVEDPRITRIGDTFYAVYCGVTALPEDDDWSAANCMASSTDLIHWHKHGVMQGDINCGKNKDGVLFPEKIDGKYVLLHRPMIENQPDHRIHIAISDTLYGAWTDCGVALRAMEDPLCESSWVGAGSVPIPLGDKKYLFIYHTGNLLKDGDREYDLDAAIFNFSSFATAFPESIVESRIDRIMAPETETEISAPFADSVSNVVFTCGSYEFQGYIYIIYGGGDTFILAARVQKQTLLDELDRIKVSAPTAVLV